MKLDNHNLIYLSKPHLTPRDTAYILNSSSIEILKITINIHKYWNVGIEGQFNLTEIIIHNVKTID